MHDIIVIGGGAAGLSSSLYAARRELKVLMISKDIGGQALMTHHIENYPGVKLSTGLGLMEQYKIQAEEAGVEIISAEVTALKQHEQTFSVDVGKKIFESRAVIVASGLVPRDLNVPGEQKFKGSGIWYGMPVKVEPFVGKNIVVIGGGSSARDMARYLAPHAQVIYLIHRHTTFRGESVSLTQLQVMKNVQFIMNSVVVELQGDTALTGVVVKPTEGLEETSLLRVDAAFVAIGREAKVDFLPSVVKLDDNKRIVIDAQCHTSCPGIFAAGDSTNTPYHQLVIAAGEGCKAALAAYQYLQRQEGKPLSPDWN